MTEFSLRVSGSLRAWRLMVVSVCLVCALLVTSQAQTQKEPLHIAVATNFIKPAQDLAQAFEREYQIKIKMSTGSTAKLTSQIEFGLPVSVFLAADQQRPQRLRDLNLALQIIDYAIGRLVLWRPANDLQANTLGQSSLITAKGQTIAIANPKLAPYGKAAIEVLESLKTNQAFYTRNRLVRGESVAQALQFALSGNAQLAFIARSQKLELEKNPNSNDQFWLIPNTLHQPIKQAAVRLNDSAEAKLFMQFMQSEIAQNMIKQHGYDLP